MPYWPSSSERSQLAPAQTLAPGMGLPSVSITTPLSQAPARSCTTKRFSTSVSRPRRLRAGCSGVSTCSSATPQAACSNSASPAPSVHRVVSEREAAVSTSSSTSASARGAPWGSSTTTVTGHRGETTKRRSSRGPSRSKSSGAPARSARDRIPAPSALCEKRPSGPLSSVCSPEAEEEKIRVVSTGWPTSSTTIPENTKAPLGADEALRVMTGLGRSASSGAAGGGVTTWR